MILTCPECATSYFVDDSRVPAGGRLVKCANCGARWRALPKTPGPEPAAEEVPSPEPEAASLAEAPAAEPGDLPGPAESSVEEVAEAARARRAALRRARPASQPVLKRVALVAWGLAALAVAAAVAGLVLCRSQVVRAWPQASTVYEGVGLPVLGGGLKIEAVKAEPTFQGGRPVLAITGAIRNLRGGSVGAPSLRVTLLDKGGRPVAVKIAQPIDNRIPARGLRHFAVAFVDPPATAHGLEVAFDGGGEATVRAPAKARPADDGHG